MGIARWAGMAMLAGLLAASAGSPCPARGEVATRAALRGDGTLLVNGEPVFPVGVRSEKLDEIEPVARCGFNLILGSGEWTSAHYARAHEEGLIILAGHHVWATFRGAGPGIDLAAIEEEGGVDDLLEKARDQSGRSLPEALRAFDPLPGVIGWKIGDEPRGSLTQIVTHGYEAIKSFSPNHLVAVMTDKQEWAAGFRNACDVMLVDLFALRGIDYPHREAASLSDVHDRVARCVDAMREKTVWYMPQLYPPSAWKPFRPGEELTRTDMRLQVYVGLVAGARGIVFYHWGVLDKARRRDGGDLQWEVVDDAVLSNRVAVLTSTVEELHRLGPILCDGRPNTDPYLRWIAPGINGPGPQYTRAIEYDGKQYLLVVNLLDAPIAAKVYGRNVDSNLRAYDAAVFSGESDLSVVADTPGEPQITVGPRGAGAFVLTRRPTSPGQFRVD